MDGVALLVATITDIDSMKCVTVLPSTVLSVIDKPVMLRTEEGCCCLSVKKLDTRM